MRAKVTLEASHSIYCGYLWEVARFLSANPELAKNPTIVDAVHDGLHVVWAREKRPNGDWFILCGSGPEAPDEPVVWAHHIVWKQS